MPVTYGNNYGKLLEPGLRKTFFETYKEKPEQYSQVFNILTSKKAIETDSRMGGFSTWNSKASLDATEFEDPTKLDTVMYKHTTFSKGFVVDKELVDDEMYGQISKLPKSLARAARATIESQAITVLNTAFTPAATNFQGEALVGSHTRLDGGTTTNTIGDYALSEANLEIAMKLASEQVDERGLKIQMMPDILVVPRALEYTAKKIIKSAQLPGGNFNDINPMKDQFKVVVLDYLTDQNNWFLIDSTMNPLNFFWREKLNFKQDSDFDTDVSKYKGRMRFSYGWTDHRGILGANVTGG
jgi:phage major head subunit gpT-like protein